MRESTRRSSVDKRTMGLRRESDTAEKQGSGEVVRGWSAGLNLGTSLLPIGSVP